MPPKLDIHDSLRIIALTVLSGMSLIVVTSCGSMVKGKENPIEGSLVSGESSEASNAEVTEDAPENFNYCPVQSVRKSTENSGGLAALTSLLKYWDTEASEPELVKAYPSTKSGGHDLHELQRIAIDKGLTAFALTMKAKPLEHLSEQLEHGRPILVTVRFADGTYFGQKAGEVSEIAQNAGSDSGTPTIQKDREHYVVVFGQSEKQYLIMDPTFGVLSVDKETFVKYWKEEKYSALLCST